MRKGGSYEGREGGREPEGEKTVVSQATPFSTYFHFAQGKGCGLRD